MFPSSGLFAHLNCPFAQLGLCERPHCFYKHATETWKWFGGFYKSPVNDLKGGQCQLPDVTHGAPVNDESADESFHELERINKEIETVRHEVEQEQRRLSCYQTLQADTKNLSSISKYETSSSCGLPLRKNHKTDKQAKKYVVDNSKPKTDLEYDPLSNFSAALHPHSSSAKGHKVKNTQDVKRSRSVHFDQNEPSIHQMYRSPSPEFPDDSDDSVLIVDIPLSASTSSPAQKSVGSVTEESSQHEEGKIRETQTEAVFHNYTQLNPKKVAFSLRNDNRKMYSTCAIKNKQNVLTCDDKEYKNVDGSVADSSRCLKELERECQSSSFQSAERAKKVCKPAASPASFEPEVPSRNNPQCERSDGTERVNPLHTNDSPCLKSGAASSCPMQHTPKHAPTTDKPAQGKVQSPWCPLPSVPVVVQGSKKTPNKLPGKMQGNATMNKDQAKAGQGTNQFPSQHVSSPVNPHSRAESSQSTEQLLKTQNETVIIISSDEDDDKEESYSETEISDSDTVLECYRIFTEENPEVMQNPDLAVGDEIHVDKPKAKPPHQALPGKKRMAHEAKNLEEPLAKRSKPQLVVPHQDPAPAGLGSQPFIPSRVQHRTSTLTASVVPGQAFVSSTSQQSEMQATHFGLSPGNLQPAPVHNSYLNCLPVGTKVMEVGNNLHFVLPQGGLPLPLHPTSSTATSIVTSVNHVHPSPVTMNQSFNQPAVNSQLRYQTVGLLLTPPQRPALQLSLASGTLHSTAAPTTSQAAVQVAAKPKPVKRKMKQQTVKEKIHSGVRLYYVNKFRDEILKTIPDSSQAQRKAEEVEKDLFNRSMNQIKYLSIAVNTLKKMQNQSAAVKNNKRVQGQRLKGKVSFNGKKMKMTSDDMTLYESMKDYILTDEKKIENNYPVQDPEKPGCAVFTDKKVNKGSFKRICCRCGVTYSVSLTGKHIRTEECNYHYGKGVENRVPGGVETRYSCCQGVMGAPGCQVFKLHVHDALSLDGFVSTAPRCPSDTSCPGVYSLACEMCYTIQGLELSRVTVVDSKLQVIYDTFVSPDNEVIDYNTRFSGISEEDVQGNHTSLREVQDTLLSFISTDTILVGHGLEMALRLLKLLHGMVVDTSVVFPHHLGPPNKLSLNSLTAEYLRKIIQETDCGRDTAEDAVACMELVLWKMKEDGKLKK